MPAIESEKRGRLSVELYRSPNSASEVPRQPEKVAVNVENIVEVDLLPVVEDSRRAYMEWNEISCFVPNFFIKKNRALEYSKTIKRALTFSNSEKTTTKAGTGPPPKKQILYSVTGHARAGEILALMGPSGSGKTTLISVLGGRAPKMMTTTGKVTFNGVELNKSIRRSVGYVAQDDLLFETLSVYETLYYAALLKLPKTMSRAEKLERVEAVISALGLSKCRDTLIGGGFRRGVSGGERKRVSVGHELLTNPSVLVLDEPTSGLDSTTAMRLISSLRSLADGGRVVVTTIHQPSSRLFQQLSNLMLLSEGRVLYYGSSHLAVDWFDQKGFPLPYGVNVADFILDISNGDVEENHMDGEASRLHLVQEMTKYLSANPYGFSEESSIPASRTEHFALTDSVSKQALLGTEKKSDRWGASFLEQVGILLSRAARNRRFSSLSYQNMCQGFAISIIITLLWWQSGDGITLLVANDMSALIFFMLMFTMMGVMFKAIFTFPNVFRVMVKERTSGMYRLSAFYIAETFCDIPLDFSIPASVLTIVYWGAHFRQTFIAYISTLCIAVLSGLTVQTIGLLLGATVRNPQSATAMASVIVMAMMLSTGFWVRDIPSWISWFKYVAPPYWAYRLALQVQFHDREFKDCGGINEDQLPIDQCKPAEDLGKELSLDVDMNGTKWPPILVLFAMLFFLRFITYYVLKAKTAY